jgi:lipopolysaccharide export system permease protein
MMINDTMKTHLREYRTPLQYWRSKERAKSKKHMMITDVLLSLFPIFSLFAVASMGIVHARHQKSKIYIYLFSSIVIYYGLTIGLQDVIGYYTIPVVAFSWLAATYFIYRKTIVNKF